MPIICVVVQSGQYQLNENNHIRIDVSSNCAVSVIVLEI